MDEILINTTTAGDQEQPGVAGLSGPQFAVVWADRAGGNIKGQLLGVNGGSERQRIHRQLSGNAGDEASTPGHH